MFSRDLIWLLRWDWCSAKMTFFSLKCVDLHLDEFFWTALMMASSKSCCGSQWYVFLIDHLGKMKIYHALLDKECGYIHRHEALILFWLPVKRMPTRMGNTQTISLDHRNTCLREGMAQVRFSCPAYGYTSFLLVADAFFLCLSWITISIYNVYCILLFDRTRFFFPKMCLWEILNACS